MDNAAAHTALTAAPQARMFSPVPRHAVASRRLMGVRAGAPTIVACILAFGVLTTSALGGPQHHAKALGTAPVAHVAATTPANA